MAASTALKLTRWLLVPVSVSAIVMGSYLGGRAAVTLADARCQAEHMIGGACVEPWHTGLVELAIYTAMVLAALALAIIPATIAPNGKRIVSGLLLASLLAALAVVYYYTRFPELLPPMAAAALAAVLGFIWIYARRKPHA